MALACEGFVYVRLDTDVVTVARELKGRCRQSQTRSQPLNSKIAVVT